MFEREQHGEVTVLRLAHGKASALDLELLEGLLAQLEELADCPALVLTGSGGIFSAGVDLVRLRDGGDYVAQFLPALNRTVLRLFELDLPVVAAINGHAIAGGCILACAADLRLMATGKGKLGLPELRVGVPLPVAAIEIVGRLARGRDNLALRGPLLGPDAALAEGLVDELHDPEELLERAVAAAADLATLPRAPFVLAKRTLRAPALRNIAAGADGLDDAIAAAWRSPAVLDAVDAYVRATLGR